MSYDEHLITQAGGDGDRPCRAPSCKLLYAHNGPCNTAPTGDGDPLDAIQRRAEKFIAAHDEMLRIDQGIGGLAVERPDLMPDFEAWDRASDVVHADTALELLATIRTQQATIAAVLALANAHGRRGFLVTPADIRATLAP